MYDVIIIGGGPAGLSAALVLGRCRRKVLLIDGGKPRNRWATHLHGYLTRDGILPAELLRLGREEIRRYGVDYIAGTAATARREVPGGHAEAPRTHFEVTLKDGRQFASRKMLLATGVQDILPDIENFETYYGRGVHHCPYCDAWEYRDKHIVAYGQGNDAVGAALGLLTWTTHVTLCSNGEELDEKAYERLKRSGITVRTEKVISLAGTSGSDGILNRIVFENGSSLGCDALFFSTGHIQHSHLPLQLGCEIEKRDEIRTGARKKTGVPGLFLCGDADGDVQFAIVAAAEGATAAVTINHELQLESLAP